MASDNAQGARPFSLGAAGEGIGNDSEVGPGSDGPQAFFPFQDMPPAIEDDPGGASCMDVNMAAVKGSPMPFAKASSKPGAEDPRFT